MKTLIKILANEKEQEKAEDLGLEIPKCEYVNSFFSFRLDNLIWFYTDTTNKDKDIIALISGSVWRFPFNVKLIETFENEVNNR